MRLHRVTLGLAAAAMLVLGGATAAWADPPVDLGSQQLVDSAGALSASQETTVRDTIQSYDDATGSDLRVVFVKTFTDPTDRQQWAVDTANRGDSTSDVVVLAVATAGQFGLALSSDFPLDKTTTGTIATSTLAAPFKNGDWAGGVQAFATGLEKAQASGSSGSGTSANDPSSSGSGSSGALTVFLLIALVVVVIIVIGVFRRRSRRAVVGGAPAAAVGPPPVDQKVLDQQASRALIALDDDLTTSEQELGFAVAEFGDAAAKPFSDALATAKQHAQAAFAIRQQLDDDVPETPPQQREMTERIIALCKEAADTLSAQTASNTSSAVSNTIRWTHP